MIVTVMVIIMVFVSVTMAVFPVITATIMVVIRADYAAADHAKGDCAQQAPYPFLVCFHDKRTSPARESEMGYFIR